MFIEVAFLTPKAPLALGVKAKDDGRHIKVLTAKVLRRIVFNKSRYVYIYTKGGWMVQPKLEETDESVVVKEARSSDTCWQLDASYTNTHFDAPSANT